MIPVILLVGGLGTRLAAVSDGLPKPMVQVAGRPFVERVLDMLISTDVDRAFMAVSYRWEVLRNHFGDNYRGLPLTYSVENEPLGTGGAILKCFRQYGIERALILNGDTLFRINLTELIETHKKSDALITMALRRMTDTSRYGVVTCDAAGRVTAFQNSGDANPGLVNGGIYVVERGGLEKFPLPLQFSFERDFLQKYVTDLLPLGVESGSYFIDIGVPEDLARAQYELSINV